MGIRVTVSKPDIGKHRQWTGGTELFADYWWECKTVQSVTVGDIVTTSEKKEQSPYDSATPV